MELKKNVKMFMDLIWIVILIVALIALFLIIFIVCNSSYLKNVSEKLGASETKNNLSKFLNINKSVLTLCDKMNSGMNSLVLKLDSLSAGLSSLNSAFVDVGKSTEAGLSVLNSSIVTVRNILMPDYNLPLTNECIASEKCLMAYLKRKFLLLEVTNANSVVNQGSADTVSVLGTNRVFFSDGNYYANFFMPAGVENDLLFVHVMSGYSVVINNNRTTLGSNLVLSYNMIAVFINKGDKWHCVIVFPASKFS